MLNCSRDTNVRHAPEGGGVGEEELACVTPDLSYDWGRGRWSRRTNKINGMEKIPLDSSLSWVLLSRSTHCMWTPLSTS